MLIAFSAGVYVTMRHHLYQRIDSGLSEELADVLYEVERADNPTNLHDWLDRRFAPTRRIRLPDHPPSGERSLSNHRLADKKLPIPAAMSESPLRESFGVDRPDVGESSAFESMVLMVR